MMRRAVILGGAGFVGRRLTELLAGPADGDGPRESWPEFDAIEVADIVPLELDAALQSRLNRSGCQLSQRRVDVREPHQVVQAVRGAHTVFHLASVVDVGLGEKPELHAINVEGTRHVVEACKAEGVGFLIYTSTEDVVLGDRPITAGDEREPYTEAPRCAYVQTKREAERLVLQAHDGAGLRVCVLRPLHVYGPRDPHAILTALRELRAGRLPFLLGDGSARTGYVYLDNVVHGHLLAARLLAEEPERIGGHVYFLGEDNELNFFEFLRPYAESKGVALPRRRLPAPLCRLLAHGMELTHGLLGVDVPFHRFHVQILTQDFTFSSGRAAKELGYAPIVTPGEGQRRTLGWLADQAL